MTSKNGVFKRSEKARGRALNKEFNKEDFFTFTTEILLDQSNLQVLGKHVQRGYGMVQSSLGKVNAFVIIIKMHGTIYCVEKKSSRIS